MSRYITADDIAAKLEHSKRSGAGWMASCPSHDDRHASLRISPGKRATVLYCHAGCAYEDVIMALGYRKEQLFYDYEIKEWRTEKGSPINDTLRAMVAKHSVWEPTMPIQRLDDVMWEALVTDRLPDAIWIEAISQAGVQYPWLMGMAYPEAMTYSVILQDGPLFTFLRPLWESLGRPDWHKLRSQAMSKMNKTYREWARANEAAA